MKFSEIMFDWYLRLHKQTNPPNPQAFLLLDHAVVKSRDLTCTKNSCLYCNLNHIISYWVDSQYTWCLMVFKTVLSSGYILILLSIEYILASLIEMCQGWSRMRNVK